MTKAVFALANDEDHANKIVNKLLSAGFSTEEVSVLLASKQGKGLSEYEYEYERPNGSIKEKTSTQQPLIKGKHAKGGKLGHEKSTKAPEGGATGAVAGGIIGGSLGLLAGIGSLAIPGLGFFIAAGPILAALSGSALGGSLGLVIGALIGLGIPEYEAKKYESSLKKGNVLICVHIENANQIEIVKNILKKEGAHDIATSWEKAGTTS